MTFSDWEIVSTKIKTINKHRLLNFPDAIPTSLVTMNLDRNQIENVDSMYENAENLLLLHINFNPLSCDVNLFNFIVDMLDKRVNVLMEGFCKPFLTGDCLFYSLSFFKQA